MLCRNTIASKPKIRKLNLNIFYSVRPLIQGIIGLNIVEFKRGTLEPWLNARAYRNRPKFKMGALNPLTFTKELRYWVILSFFDYSWLFVSFTLFYLFIPQGGPTNGNKKQFGSFLDHPCHLQSIGIFCFMLLFYLIILLCSL